jgi:hypothetical protein
MRINTAILAIVDLSSATIIAKPAAKGGAAVVAAPTPAPVGGKPKPAAKVPMQHLFQLLHLLFRPQSVSS